MGRFARIDSRFGKKKTLFCELTFQKMDSSEERTRSTRISMRIGEKTRFAQIWPSASRIGLFLRIDSRESAKRWCANRLPNKVYSQDKQDDIQQYYFWNYFPKLSPLHLNSEIPPVLFFISTSEMSTFS